MSPSGGNPPTRLRFDIPSDFAHGRDVQERIMHAVSIGDIESIVGDVQNA